MSECPYCQNTFEMQDTCSDEFRMWQGLQGPYYIPSVDENGVISWTNTGGLPNPDAVDISGPPGKGLTIKGVVATVGDLPANPEEGDTYLVGATDPYDGYIWLNGTWVELGDISKGETGEGVPTGGTTGQVLKKASNVDYDTEWGIAGEPATSAPLMDGTAAVGTSTKYAREDHVHPVYDQIVRPNLLDNWYFVGGGSQQGGGQFPINQRGQTSYSGAVYGIDRWRSWDGGTSVTVNGNYLTLATGANSDGIFQYFQNIGQFHNKTITVSALVNGSLYTATGTATTTAWIARNIDGDGSYLGFILTASEANVRIILAANKTATITAIKLELGTTQTLAHQENGAWVLNEIPNYQQELAKCQRYFVKVPTRSYCGAINGTTAAYFFVPTPVSLAKIPTLVNVASFAAWIVGGTNTGFTLDCVELLGTGVTVWLHSTETTLSLACFEFVPSGGDVFLSAEV